jgi:hypothetical protein
MASVLNNRGMRIWTDSLYMEEVFCIAFINLGPVWELFWIGCILRVISIWSVTAFFDPTSYLYLFGLIYDASIITR